MNITQIYDVFKKSEGLSTDTRSIKDNQIFLALKGDSFDGNQYADYALSKGASYAIVDDQNVVKDDRYILVMDTLHTLQNLANYHRNQFDIPVFAMTGSNGKTTTKELLAAVLEKKFNLSYTKGNLNNHIGVPLTLLDVTEQSEFALVEMGANKIGDIRELCAIANPTHGLVTNVGIAHLEGFGSFEGVVKTKTELYDFLINKDAITFYNDEETILKENVARSKSKIAFQDQHNKWDVSSDGTHGLVISNGVDEIVLRLTGSYNVSNVAAAICVCNYFGVPFESIKERLEQYEPTNNRSEVKQVGSNTVIMDAYNANPSSMKVAIENLSSKGGDKLVLLGDMFELGKYADAAHKEVVKQIEGFGIKGFLIGEEFVKASLDSSLVTAFQTKKEFLDFLKGVKIKNHTILVKGSRGMALENLIDSVFE